MLWQIIQYSVLTSAEIMVSITVLIFAYSEAPSRYKVVILSLWFSMIAFGDILVMMVAGARLASNQVSSKFAYERKINILF